MNLIKYDNKLGNLIDRFFDNPFFDSLDKAFSKDDTKFVPSVDIYEKDGKVHLNAEMPGMEKDSIDVKLHDGILTISGERKSENEVKEDNYYKCERSYGSFSRSFKMPENITADDINAEYKDGVLKLSFEKKEYKDNDVTKIDIE